MAQRRPYRRYGVSSILGVGWCTTSSAVFTFSILGWGAETTFGKASAAMISGSRQRIRNGPIEGSRASGTSPLFRLSATMVELSLRHKQPDSHADIRAKVVPIRVEPCMPEAKVQLANRSMAATTEEEGTAAPIRQSGLAQAGREFLRTFSCRVSARGIKVFALRPTRTIYAALALLAFLSVYALRHQPDSVKSQAQIPAPVKSQALVPSASPHKIPNHLQTITARKAKPRRPQSDYIAKDTLTYYGKDGKPSH